MACAAEAVVRPQRRYVLATLPESSAAAFIFLLRTDKPRQAVFPHLGTMCLNGAPLHNPHEGTALREGVNLLLVVVENPLDRPDHVRYMPQAPGPRPPASRSPTSESDTPPT